MLCYNATTKPIMCAGTQVVRVDTTDHVMPMNRWVGPMELVDVDRYDEAVLAGRLVPIPDETPAVRTVPEVPDTGSAEPPLRRGRRKG